MQVITQKKNQVIIISKDIEYPLVSGINEYVAGVSFIYLCGVNDKYSEQHDMVANIYFEAIVTTKKLTYFISS